MNNINLPLLVELYCHDNQLLIDAFKILENNNFPLLSVNNIDDTDD